MNTELISPDVINGTFEFVGSLFLLNNVRMLRRIKSTESVSICSTVFFCLWGVWNLFYFPHLNQWYSFLGGISMAAANATWIVMLTYYRFWPQRSSASRRRSWK